MAMNTACTWLCSAPSPPFCTELGAFPATVGDGVGHFPFREVIFIIIITGFCQYYRNWGEKKKRD